MVDDGKNREFRRLVFTALTAEADALWDSLSQNHPFVDGNKRTAFGAMFAFLAINGTALTAGPDQP